VKFAAQSGVISLDLDKISVFRITRQRTTCELPAITPENPYPQTPCSRAGREKEWKIRKISGNLQQHKRGEEDGYHLRDNGY
jgi:hypothetical protein